MRLSFSGKLPPNRMLNLAVGGSIAVQILAMLIPGLRAILGTTPLGLIGSGGGGRNFRTATPH